MLDTVKDIYSHSTSAVRTGRESYTANIPQNHGVKQGCPLSPILFNIVLEGMLKHLATNKAGYAFTGHTVNSLAYVDDICVVASTKTELQGLLDQCCESADWARFVFNARKCGSLCPVNETPLIHVNHLFSPLLGAESIPALSWNER